jgi:hypothetical protein
MTALILASFVLLTLAPRVGGSPFQNPTQSPPGLSRGQEVQMQVNRALLRATVIRATYEVVHFGDGVEKSTAAAFEKEYNENIATIEALRPTAVALDLVLVENPIQPTLESEATLFAEACQAAGPICRLASGTRESPTPYETQDPAMTATPDSPPVNPTPPALTPYP